MQVCRRGKEKKRFKHYTGQEEDNKGAGKTKETYPVFLLSFPPIRIIAYDAIDTNPMTTDNVMRNPVVRHILQKYRSLPSQSLFSGNG